MLPRVLDCASQQCRGDALPASLLRNDEAHDRPHGLVIDARQDLGCLQAVVVLARREAHPTHRLSPWYATRPGRSSLVRGRAGSRVFLCRGRLHEEPFALKYMHQHHFGSPPCMKSEARSSNRAVVSGSTVRELTRARPRSSRTPRARSCARRACPRLWLGWVGARRIGVARRRLRPRRLGVGVDQPVVVAGQLDDDGPHLGAVGVRAMRRAGGQTTASPWLTRARSSPTCTNPPPLMTMKMAVFDWFA